MDKEAENFGAVEMRVCGGCGKRTAFCRVRVFREEGVEVKASEATWVRVCGGDDGCGAVTVGRGEDVAPRSHDQELGATVVNLRGQIKRLAGEKEKMAEVVAALESALADFNAKLGAAYRREDSLRAERAGLQEKVWMLEKLAAKEQREESHQAECAGLQEKVWVLEEKVEVLQAEKGIIRENCRGEVEGLREMLVSAQRRAADASSPLKGFLKQVLEERERQRAKWSAEHDDGHVKGELVLGGASYALRAIQGDNLILTRVATQLWPFRDSQKSYASPEFNLVVAGAMLLAEWERAERAVGNVAPSDGLGDGV